MGRIQGRSVDRITGDYVANMVNLETRVLQPEKRLLWAMLKRWLLDYTGICRRVAAAENPIEARFSAVEWCWSDEDGPFSFLWVCDVLELDVEWVRHNADRIAKAPPSLSNNIFGSLEI